MQLLRATAIRDLDQQAIAAGTPSLELMERAGRGCAQSVQRRYPDLARREVHVLCGPGNNGGDGLVVARYLAGDGIRVRVYLTHPPEQCSDELRANLERLPATIPVVALHGTRELPDFSLCDPRDLLIDALLGVGLRGPLREPYTRIITAIRDFPGTVIALDVPSGAGDDNGQVTEPVITAQVTLTIGLPKVGLYLEPAAHHAGEIEVIPLEYPAAILDAFPPQLRLLDGTSLKPLLMPRIPEGHKGTYGKLLIVGGSRGMAGSVALAGAAALRAGAGMVTIATAASAQPIVAGFQREVMTVPLTETPDGVIAPQALRELLPWLEWADTLALGPGLTTAPSARALTGAVLDHWEGPLVLDADGLKIAGAHLDQLAECPIPVICTPHLGEAAALLGKTPEEIALRRLDTVLDAAERYRLVLVLKGYRTLIAAPGSQASISTAGNPGLATAGTGDVLTGIIGAELAQGLPPYDAARLGVWLHGTAADLAAARHGPISMIAGDVIAQLGAAIRGMG